MSEFTGQFDRSSDYSNKYPAFTPGQMKNMAQSVGWGIDEYEKDPNGRDAKSGGAKLDAGKAPVFRGLLDYFPRACLAVAEVSDVGAIKYSWKGFETVPDGVNRYQDALCRHIVKEAIEGAFDSDTKLLHKAHTAWNALAALELYLRELNK